MNRGKLHNIRLWPSCTRGMAPIVFAAVVIGSLTAACKSWGADPQSATVATVNGVAITAADVERQLAAALGSRQVSDAEKEALRSQAVQVLVDREFVLSYLRAQKFVISDTEVNLAIDRLKKDLLARDESIEDYLAARSMDETTLRKLLMWEMSWQRFFEKYRNDATLEKFFSKHRRDFDGSEIRVAHILFAVPKEADQAQRTAIQQRAENLLQKIKAGEITFREAATQYSTSPSRETGGDIGFIRRREPMPESFSQLAFSLEPGVAAGPVETAFGFHLVQCLEIRPGQKQWADVRDELEIAVGEYLFRWAAAQARKKSSRTVDSARK